MQIHTTAPSSQSQRLTQLKTTQSGQVGIIMLLITVVMLTVGISAVSRTTSDLNISTTNEQANRALDAAESDVEKALSGPLSEGTTTTNAGQFAVKTDVLRNSSLAASVDQGYTIGIDLAGNGSVPVSVQWAKEAACANQASLVITILNNANQIRRYYVGPYQAGCNRNDGFADPTGNGAAPYRFSYTITPQAGDTMMRIRPLYNDTDLSVTGAALPTQSYTVTSSAQNTESRETKAVQVDRTLPVAPGVLDYVLFSGTSITQ